MTRSSVLLAWGLLLALGLVSTAVAMPGYPDVWKPVAGAAILLVAGLKARLILLRYLGLSTSAFWSRGATVTLSVFCLLLLGLYLLPLAI